MKWRSRIRTVVIVAALTLCGALTGALVGALTDLLAVVQAGAVIGGIGGMWLGSKAARPS